MSHSEKAVAFRSAESMEPVVEPELFEDEFLEFANFPSERRIRYLQEHRRARQIVVRSAVAGNRSQVDFLESDFPENMTYC